MIRKILDKAKGIVENRKSLSGLKPLVAGIDTFFYESPLTTRFGPHIRDAVDLKRWMILVVFALFPCIIAAIWNTGVQQYVYSSGSFALMKEYLSSSQTLSGYFSFTFQEGRWAYILKEGCIIFVPIMLISYIVGGFWEVVFASVRKHEISEGFLVTGLLYPLALPPSIPYWMVVVGVSAGVIIGKEVFGGTGMNILNPALTCRAFLYFAFPSYMTGEVWAGKNTYATSESISHMNRFASQSGADAISQETYLSIFNLTRDIKRIHVDAIASGNYHKDVSTMDVISKHFAKWTTSHPNEGYSQLSTDQLQNFVTGSFEQGGLGLSADSFPQAVKFTQLKYGMDLFSDGNMFFGNKLGSMGEVSILACLLGAFLLLFVGIASWRTMIAFAIGVFITGSLFLFGSKIGPFGGAWNPAQFDFPPYKHFLMGSIAFGLVYMATDPVSSPGMQSAKWFYGILIGVLIVVIRVLNPAYPEGVMLAILFANVFAPIFDYQAVRIYRRKRVERRKVA